MKHAIFKETQKFRQWWYILLILISTIPTIFFSLYRIISQDKGFLQPENTQTPEIVSYLILIAMPVVIYFLLTTNLQVWVTNEGINFKFPPIIRKNRCINFSDIARFEVRTYKPIIDYGGWGIKHRFKWGRAYNVSGNVGIQLYLKNGKKILFGTQRPLAFKDAIEKFFDSKKN